MAHYLEEVDHAAERIVKLDKAIDEAVKQAAPEIRAVIEALQALRGVAQTTAATVVCELGSLSRFQNPRQLMGYSGLVPREHSRAAKCSAARSPRRGNAHLRRVLVEAAWAYQHRPSVRAGSCEAEAAGDLERRGQTDRLEGATAAAQALHGVGGARQEPRIRS